MTQVIPSCECEGLEAKQVTEAVNRLLDCCTRLGEVGWSLLLVEKKVKPLASYVQILILPDCDIIWTSYDCKCEYKTYLPPFFDQRVGQLVSSLAFPPKVRGKSRALCSLQF